MTDQITQISNITNHIILTLASNASQNK